MRGGLIVVSTLTWIVASCSSSPPGAGTASTTVAPDVTTAVTTVDIPCNYTDPGVTPISVKRAMSCSDGTQVWVRGTVKTIADGTHWLCDEPSQTADQCAQNGLKLVGGGDTGDIFLGVKQGNELRVGGGLTGPPSLGTIPPGSPPTT